MSNEELELLKQVGNAKGRPRDMGLYDYVMTLLFDIRRLTGEVERLEGILTGKGISYEENQTVH